MIVAIKLRSEIGTRKDVRDTFKILGMKKLYSFKVMNNDSIGMLRRINNYIAWGEVSDEMIKSLEGKKLKAPRGGLKSNRLYYPKGDLGNHKKIEELIRKMI